METQGSELQDLCRRLAEAEGDPKQLREAWRIAQTICAKVSPSTQDKLDNVRRKIVATLHQEQRKLSATKAVMSATKPPKRYVWTMIQISPGIHQDTNFLGGTIPLRMLKDLNTALKAQIRVVRGVCR